jgi:hypothetical protein
MGVTVIRQVRRKGVWKIEVVWETKAFLLNDDGELIIERASRAAFAPIKHYRISERSTWV